MIQIRSWCTPPMGGLLRPARISFAVLAVWIFASAYSASPDEIASSSDSQHSIDSAIKNSVVREIADNLRRRYVYASAGASIAATIRARMFQGEYIEIDSPIEFARRLTIDLVEASGDQHLQVVYDPEYLESDPAADPDAQVRSRRPGDTAPFGFEKLEILPGNIGYLRLTAFAPVDLAADTARAAMTYLANTAAIVIDLRDNHGGSPTMLPLLASYFFDDEPIHLASVHWRGGSTVTEAWTRKEPGGMRMPETPLYILTSAETFSIAEELAYSLKYLRRAKIVGQRTRGGAHRGGHVLVGSGFALFVPTGATISPVTGTNWEGVGVRPDLDVPAEKALDVALQAARQITHNPAR